MGGTGTRIGIETWHYQVSNLADPTKLEVKPFYRKIFTLLKKKRKKKRQKSNNIIFYSNDSGVLHWTHTISNRPNKKLTQKYYPQPTLPDFLILRIFCQEC